MPYKSPVVMWTSELILVKIEEVDGEELPVYMCRGKSTRKIPKD
tara:strand:+ start:138 stop:269 length:132 start_codon:yes stop_codon:yes gene_type:complete